MSNMAVSASGAPLFSEKFSEAEWLKLKGGYQLGELTMPCCGAPAVPKTSANGLQFFAHHSDECSSSPESIWHVPAKNVLVEELLELNVSPYLEKSGGKGRSTWKADVYFSCDHRDIAIEVQHSYQPLTEYLRRQERYVQDGIECYWLVYPEKYLALNKSLGKRRIKTEFEGKIPASGVMPCIPELPLVCLDSSEMGWVIRGAAFFRTTASDWLKSLLERRFVFCDGNWVIS